MVRDERGAWRPPSFVTMAGGSFGWQIGVQVTDIVLVFKTRNSVQGLLSGKFTLGADAAAAAGPVGREAAAATDASLQAEIYTYSRSRGLFAGVSLDGSVLQIDHAANSLYYRGANVTDPNLSIPLSPSVMNLMRQVSLYTGAPSGATANAAPALAPTSMSLPGGTPAQVAPTAAAPRAAPPTLPAAMPVGGDVQFARQRLAESSMQLYAVLDGNWRSYLAMPAEVYAGDRAPSAQSIQQTLSRFDGVARDPRYAALSQRAEFRATHEWLTRYVASSR